MNSDDAARSEQRRHASYHEAGHAVAAIDGGIAVGCVSIRQESDGSLEGHTHTSFCVPDRPHQRLEPKELERLKGGIVVALAGDIAEEVLLGAVRPTPAVSKECQHDEFMAQKLLSIVQPWDSPALRKICEDRARVLIRQKRGAVEALAERLLAMESISGAEIENNVGEHPPCDSCAARSPQP